MATPIPTKIPTGQYHRLIMFLYRTRKVAEKNSIGKLFIVHSLSEFPDIGQKLVPPGNIHSKGIPHIFG